MYVDSCVIVKLLVPEPDSDFFDKALTGLPISSSELAITEVFSALLAKERFEAISTEERKLAWETFQNWIKTEEIVLEPVQWQVFKKSTQILEVCHRTVPLRSLDSLHVAACELCQDVPLCSTDHRVRAAAIHLGIPVYPESEE